MTQSQRCAALLFEFGVGTACPFFRPSLPSPASGGGLGWGQWSAGRRQGFARPLMVPGISSEAPTRLARTGFANPRSDGFARPVPRLRAGDDLRFCEALAPEPLRLPALPPAGKLARARGRITSLIVGGPP